MTFRPALRPGAPLLRRDRVSLQVGTSPGVVIADRPGLMALLRLADGTRDVARLQTYAKANIPELACDVPALIRELCALGVVFDASRWSAPHRRGLDAEARHTDLSGGELGRLTRRPQFRVAFHADAASEPIAAAARTVLADAGIRDLGSNDPDLLIIASSGEPARTVFERPTFAALDHLVVMIDEDRVRIGPLVRPGRTPCMSCYDRHRADWDHAWSALLPQFGRHTGILTPAALDAVTVHAAALEVAIEVLAHCDGRPPRTIGQFLAVGPGHDERNVWPLTFHHGCACDLLSAA
ncbi:hypothetical protein J2X11_001129 [Aeromicrobium panaciterrae]|uniref:TOMM leader peptide-binding protein n=1 Tax=Aeromicrobium panaciterrae TaxID=363861 RepID=A0ABU1UM90_9ACTN|nr:hypothetical protein [Aeromicrobium panaciterrae]MDR7086290.1 hypothetical protein [Aeromicrobium panaciterrae]